LLSDKEYNLELDISYLSYKEKYEEAIRRNVILYRNLKKLHEEMGGTQEAFMDIMSHFISVMHAVNPEGNPFSNY
jgi:Acyl-coenzyme A oxidase N-terminal